MSRKIIHTSVLPKGVTVSPCTRSEGSLIATCDDGTAWVLARIYEDYRWEQLPPIPQPETSFVSEPMGPRIIDPRDENRPKTTFDININGNTFMLAGLKSQLTYEFICKLANKNPLLLPTMTYSHITYSGHLYPHKSVIASHGMIFNVGNTTNA